jgi:hypothetical protein
VRSRILLVLFFLASAAAAQSFTTPLPGTLVRAAAVTGPDGRPGVALLVAANKDRKGAKTLLFLDPERRSLTRLATGLHEEVNTVVGFDLSGSGAPAPIAGMPGVLFASSGGKVLDEPNVDLRSVTGATAGRPWLAAARAGLLELLAPGEGGGLSRLRSFPLPVKAERQRWGLRLTSPPVTLLPGEPALFAVGPEEVSRRRIKTLLIPADGSAPAPAPAVTESWSLLPEGERLVADRRYLRLDGIPALAATSFEKIGLLARKRFRLFLLNQDRSRKGTASAFSVETDCPLWFPLDVYAADTDADGRQDLVLIHPGGMRGKEVLVSVYRGLGGERFDPKPRTWKLNEEVWDWHYGSDLTGDGTPDLLLFVKDRLFLYPGDPKGGRPLSGRPAWAVTVTGAPKKEVEVEVGEPPESDGQDIGPDRERLLLGFDLPGGGRTVLAQGFQKDGKSVLTVVWRR